MGDKTSKIASIINIARGNSIFLLNRQRKIINIKIKINVFVKV
ncbi:MAG: hypothetical protein WA066_04080 [Candidatus Omnitrophota bacterium]